MESLRTALGRKLPLAALPTCYPLSEPRLQFTKPYQSVALLVPKSETPASEALAKSDDLGDPVEFRSGVQARLKPVVGDAGAQVVDVVQADIPRKPLQD
jgi:hypothetical protein